MNKDIKLDIFRCHIKNCNCGSFSAIHKSGRGVTGEVGKRAKPGDLEKLIKEMVDLLVMDLKKDGIM